MGEQSVGRASKLCRCAHEIAPAPATTRPPLPPTPGALFGLTWRPVVNVATVVASRGVPADFCSDVLPEECTALPAVSTMRRAASEGGVISFVYVGRLSYDKSVDEMLEAFDRALDVSDAASKVSQSVVHDPYHGARAQ